MSELAIDGRDPAQVTLLEGALYLAKHLAYAAAVAHWDGDHTDAVTLWQTIATPERHVWRVRAMELLKSLNPKPVPAKLRAVPALESLVSCCIYCSARPQDSKFAPYCGALCACDAERGA